MKWVLISEQLIRNGQSAPQVKHNETCATSSERLILFSDQLSVNFVRYLDTIPTLKDY